MVARRFSSTAQDEPRISTDPLVAEDVEATRLLAPESGDDENRVATDGASGGWDGLADFKDLPWWRQPSVRLVPSLSSLTIMI